MISLSFLTRSSARQTVLTLCVLVLLTLGVQGCSDSEDKSSTTPQKNPTSTTSVPVPKDPQVSSVIGESEKDQVPGTESGISSHGVREELDKANFAIEKAEDFLRRAPMGKGSDLALSALQQDLDSARNLLRTGQTHFNEQKFEMAQTQAHQATKKASAVYKHIEQALNTVNVDSQ